MAKLFTLILMSATLITGLIWLIDTLFLAPKRKRAIQRYKNASQGEVDQAALKAIGKEPIVVETAKSFFPVLLIVFVIRSFIVEPYRIPSGSLKPTLLIGDFLVVNKFAYGLKVPLFGTKLVDIGLPEHGDIAIFYREQENMTYIKRVIGLPGDKISYINKILYVNDQPMPQEFIRTTQDSEGGFAWPVVEKKENFMGIEHGIYQRPETRGRDIRDIIVPEGHYFMLGDNRDNSQDSRAWKPQFIAEKDLIGKAYRIWFSWDTSRGGDGVRWQRIGDKII